MSEATYASWLVILPFTRHTTAVPTVVISGARTHAPCAMFAPFFLLILLPLTRSVLRNNPTCLVCACLFGEASPRAGPAMMRMCQASTPLPLHSPPSRLPWTNRVQMDTVYLECELMRSFSPVANERGTWVLGECVWESPFSFLSSLFSFFAHTPSPVPTLVV